MWDKPPPLEDLQKSLDDPNNPIGMRMRAAYYLRQAHTDHVHTQDIVIHTLAKGLLDQRHGSLLRHEFAYVMGQLRDERCCETLEQILQSPTDCLMVRHEAAEALGAIGAARSRAVLQALVQDRDDPSLKEVLSDTCQLALNVMEWRASGENMTDMPAACACMLSPYSSVDPAPPHPAHEHYSFVELGNVLCDAAVPMFERYRAMFSLRNRGGAAAVEQLCRALVTDTSSPLLRHEVAYVLGQMQHPDSVEALAESLGRLDEHMMVRHESAEALGAIDGRWEQVEKILNSFLTDENDVVRESCMVALDAADYWGHSGNTEKDETQEEEESGKQQSFVHLKDNRVLVNHFNISNETE